MGFYCGIVGLPNVGKSTLFNALTKAQAAQAANYPFCTIEPNIGKVAVPDDRLNFLAKTENSEKCIYAQMEFVDIAGLVKGASKGEGLGNKFLSNIREVDVIIHLVRCFDDPNVIHVHGKVDPIYDIEIIETELILADLESAEKRIPNLEKKAKQGDHESKEMVEILQAAYKVLSQGKAARFADVERKLLKRAQLLTSKDVIYVSNVPENEAKLGNAWSDLVRQKAESENCKHLIISSKIEEEISLIESEEERKEFLSAIDLDESGLNKMIRIGYQVLGLKSYFTVGPKEARAWTFTDGTNAPGAAGIIHTDFERGFIRAEVTAYEDYLKHNGLQGSKDAGRMRLEGKEYLVQDGDIIHFRFNV
jgi:GTP-binding protein YchF